LRALALALLAALASGCILVIDNETNEPTDTCHFRGEDTACGRCIATACRSDLGECCGNSSCRPQLPKIEGCASAPSPESCDLTSTFDLAAGLAIGLCIEFSCLSECR
jgi:hypothetical protein